MLLGARRGRGTAIYDLRSRLPAQSLMERTLELHPQSFYAPSGDALPWYTGALGEIAVAGILGWLGPEWTVLHSVPVGRDESDIDHVVIGPAGVFTINTKSHVGKDVWIGGYGLLVSGQKTHYITNAIHEGARAEKLLTAVCGLTVPVTPVLVLINPGKRTVKTAPEGGVRVVADWELLDVLRGRPVFSDEQTERIVAAAIRPDTWHQHPAAPVDTRMLVIQFNAIMARGHQGAVAPPAVASLAPEYDPAPATRARKSPQPRPQVKRAPSTKRQRARQAAKTEAIAKLIVFVVAAWVLIGVVVPAMEAATTP